MPRRHHTAAWIAAGLKQRDKTQRGLALALGVDPATINRILKGTRRLRLDEIEPTARYLGIEAPEGFAPTGHSPPSAYIDLAPELRAAVMQRALDMGIEPQEFLARAVRSALTILGPRRGVDSIETVEDVG